MEGKQIELLTALAKKLKAEKKDRATVIASLQDAKILTKRGNFTVHYSFLNRAVPK